MTDQPPRQPRTFTIRFGSDVYVPAIRFDPSGDVRQIVQAFALKTPSPALFISGGAGLMTEKNIADSQRIVREGIARFAQDYHVTVVDGGTESGVMKMIGDARRNLGYTFPLIGVCPSETVTYPGHPNMLDRVMLEDGNSHFVLVEGEDWGVESETLVNLTRAIAGGTQPMMGVLINGGQIAEKDIFLATSQQHGPIPVLIVDGTGRKADEIADATQTGITSNQIVKAIIRGGDIRVIALEDGPQKMYELLKAHFQR